MSGQLSSYMFRYGELCSNLDESKWLHVWLKGQELIVSIEPFVESRAWSLRVVTAKTATCHGIITQILKMRKLSKKGFLMKWAENKRDALQVQFAEL